jgi:hypothetical protein
MHLPLQPTAIRVVHTDRQTRWLLHLRYECAVVQSRCALASIHNKPQYAHLTIWDIHAVLFTRKSCQWFETYYIISSHQNNHEIHNSEISTLIFILLLYKYVFVI